MKAWRLSDDGSDFVITEDAAAAEAAMIALGNYAQRIANNLKATDLPSDRRDRLIDLFGVTVARWNDNIEFLDQIAMIREIEATAAAMKWPIK
jgi:hypothetical protein